MLTRKHSAHATFRCTCSPSITLYHDAGLEPGAFARLFVEAGFLTPDLQLAENCPREHMTARLNRVILSATMWQTPLNIVRDIHMHFDKINVATALHRPVKLLKIARVSSKPSRGFGYAFWLHRRVKLSKSARLSSKPLCVVLGKHLVAVAICHTARFVLMQICVVCSGVSSVQRSALPTT